ncbi:MAG: ribonuclease P protein subunit [Candidatus Micrarchaeota archaeon]
MDMIMVEEWIGLRVKITQSPNPNNIGIEGEIANETQNTITILTGANERKTVPKIGARASVLGSNKFIELGQAMCRSEDRSKKLYKKVVS